MNAELPQLVVAQLKNAITLSDASSFFSGNPHICTITRWADKGIRGARLKTWRIGARRVTTPAAIEEFLAALNPVEAASHA